jgi:RNA polymerase sigma-70 factor, ECF subfamily
VQDVFVELPRLAARFRGQSQFGTFLVGVAASLSRRHVRAAARRRRALQRLAAEPREVAAACAPDAAVLSVLYAALDALPLAQRTAFVLCEVEERSAHEVALMLGVPEPTVRTRCFHARQKLRAQLERKGLCQARRGGAP